MSTRLALPYITELARSLGWVVTGRARHEFDNLSPDVQHRALKALDHIATTDWRLLRAAPIRENVWSIRLGRHYRLLFTRARLVLAIVDRGDKGFFSRE